MHAGQRLLIQHIRLTYWMTHLRQEVRAALSHCMRCERFRGEAMKQFMADLPEVRLERTRCFAVCGVDMCGPFRVRENELRKAQVLDAYLCIFVDLPTTAVHLELMRDQTTSSFLDALDRLIGRRGAVKRMFADNGRNFIGGKRRLEEQQEQWSGSEFLIGLAQRRIEWTFHCPYRSHASGIWEAAVKRCKYIFKREFSNRLFAYDHLYTAFVRIEAALNSRPLGVQRDKADEDPLVTPAHFLIGEPIIAPLGPRVGLLPDNNLDGWELAHKAEQLWWEQFYNEYIQDISMRPKAWATRHRDIRVGELVIVQEPNTPPGKWPLARVIRVYESKDKLVRTARIALGYPTNRVYDRPITMLQSLPVTPYEVPTKEKPGFAPVERKETNDDT